MRSAKFRLAKVFRALMCVADMVDRNQKVIFEKVDGVDKSRVADLATGTETQLVRRSQIYEMVMEVVAARGFPRQR